MRHLEQQIGEYYVPDPTRLHSKDSHPLALARKAVERYPTEPTILQSAAFAAVVEEQPDVALAMKGNWPVALAVYREKIGSVNRACRLAPPTMDRACSTDCPRCAPRQAVETPR